MVHPLFLADLWKFLPMQSLDFEHSLTQNFMLVTHVDKAVLHYNKTLAPERVILIHRQKQ